MEKMNEKDLCAYVKPEVEIVTIGGDSTVMQSILPGSSDEDSDF